MGPEEIILAERPEEDKPSTGTGAVTKTAPVLSPISVEEFDKVESSMPYTMFEGRRVFGCTTGITDYSDIPLYYYCKCVQLDLTKAADRAAYGELLGKSLVMDSPVTLLWEERVVAGEKLILYLTFSEQIRIVELK